MANPTQILAVHPGSTTMGHGSLNLNHNKAGTIPHLAVIVIPFFCQYCSIPGHDTKECRKLARFLKENNITISIPTPSSPMINTSSARSTSQSTPWAMFDTGAMNHAYPEGASLHTLSEYGGPDEVVLGNGSLHGGASHAGNQHQ
ncbi:putative transcription factor interactor and regulator CCHC(Zn) family [Helianthus annuus]|nr:putative transcription factor interactor and regulator CCHC(Zn) family [Helianthus annuus]KAJ0529090.1 putative transcription factor interactor and regulator CCHC(Zn) family [Helianthus annuus]